MHLTLKKAKILYKRYLRWCSDPNASQVSKTRWQNEAEKYKDIIDRMRREALEERIRAQGVSMGDWLDWAHSLYSIKNNSTIQAPGWTVQSKARVWKNTKIWHLNSEIDCLEKVEQLIGYKIYDRERDRGDLIKDLAEIEVTN